MAQELCPGGSALRLNHHSTSQQETQRSYPLNARQRNVTDTSDCNWRSANTREAHLTPEIWHDLIWINLPDGELDEVKKKERERKKIIQHVFLCSLIDDPNSMVS